MQVSVKEQVDSMVKEFQREFALLDEIEKPMDDISSTSVLESFSSTVQELIQNLQEFDEDITVRIDAIESIAEDEDE